MTLRFGTAPSRPQESLRQEPFNIWRAPGGQVWAEFYRAQDGYRLRFPAHADFNVSPDGCTVTAYPTHEVDSATVEHLFLNQVAPLALSRQGKLVLHASAVCVDGAAVAFLGASGRGKSTLAASFASSGTPFLTDDGLQLEWRNGVPFALPSHPSIRLWEDSEQALVPRGTPMAAPLTYTPKSRFLAGTGLLFSAEPCPLDRCYFLGDGTARDVEILPARAADAVLQLVRNSFLLDIDEHDMLARHFGVISTLANMLMHFHLDYPRDYGCLQAARAALLQQGRRAP